MIFPVSGLALAEQASNPAELAKCYRAWSGIRTNHVISSSGSFVDQYGSSRGLSTPEDLALLIELRKLADLVVVDAATARNERYKRLSNAHLAIVSASGDFTSIPAASATDKVTLFSESRPTVERPGFDHHQISAADPFEKILLWAKNMEMKSLLVEAGPKLTKVCFETTKVSQSAITITPRVDRDEITVSLNPFSPSGELISLAESTNASFTLWSY
jgi:riboflavin biosynthesis pyrimidine reductase